MWVGEFGSLLSEFTLGSHIAAMALFTTRGTPHKTLIIFGVLVAVLVFTPERGVPFGLGLNVPHSLPVFGFAFCAQCVGSAFKPIGIDPANL